MVVKKLIKNIEFKGIATLPNIAKVNYFGAYPIELNNDTNTFSFARDYTYTRQEIDSKINGIKPEGLDDIKTHITTNSNNILENRLDIDSINRDLKVIKQNEKKDIHYVGEILTSNSYNTNDYGYVGDKWYLCIASGSGDVSNKSNWKPTNAPTQKVDLSNYYTKLQTNDLLKPLETRLTSIEGLNTTQSQEINTIKQDITRVEGLIPPQVDLTPYATKVELDNKINPLASQAQVKDLYDWIIAQGYLTNASLNDINNRVQTIENNVNNKLDASALDDYYTKQDANNTFVAKWYVNQYFKKIEKDSTNFIVLPKNSKVGVDTFQEYTQMFNGAVDINNNPINFDSEQCVSNNYGAYNGKSRSYINYVDFYLPSSNSNLNYFEKEFNDKNVIIFPTSNNFELSNLPNGRRLLKFQMYIPNDINANDWWPNVPQQVKEITNINFVEFFDFVVFDGNMTCRPSDISVMAGQYSHRIFIKAGQGTSTYWQGKFIRFTMVIN